jgi:hypothetical protein
MKAIILLLLSALAYIHGKDIYRRDSIFEKVFIMLDNIPNAVLENFAGTIHINHEADGRSDDIDNYTRSESWSLQSCTAEPYVSSPGFNLFALIAS